MPRWKKVLLIFSAVIIFLLGTAWSLAFFYEDSIKEIIVSNINKQLKTSVKVKNIQFSFLSKFPYATLEFTDIVMQGNLVTETNQSLLKAKQLNLNFSWWDVLGDNVSLKKIELKEASVHIYINKKGENNYTVWQSDGGNGNFQLDLKEIILDHVQFHYTSLAVKQDYSLNIRKGKFSGTFTADDFDLAGTIDSQCDQFIADEVNYVNGKNVTLDFMLHVNTSQQQYVIKKAKVKVEQLVMNVSGSVEGLKKGYKIELEIKSGKAGLKELLSLIPANYTKQLSGYQFDGNADVNASIKGISSVYFIPLVKINFSSRNASIKLKASDHTMEAIHFNGFYTNRKSEHNRSNQLYISNLSAIVDKQPFNGSLSIENLSDPIIAFHANGNVNLQTLAAFYKPDTLSQIDGTVRMNLKFNGRSNDIASYHSSGNMRMHQVSFRLKENDVPFDNINGQFTLDGNKFHIADLSGNAAGSDFRVNGNLDNLFSFLFRDNQVLTGSASLVSRNLDLNEILANKEKSTATDTAYYLDLTNRVKFLLQVNLGVVNFRRMQAWQMKGDFALQNKILSTNNLSFKMVNGAVTMQGAINTASEKDILISFTTKISKLDIHQLFYEMGNFGQEVITDKNLRGTLTADIQFAGAWTKTLHCYTDKIYANSDFAIENGELLNFEPMLELAKYLKGADLKQIKFSTLKNSIEIKNRSIYIPQMEIKSSALEVTASGTHTFDNMVDYRLQLLLSQVMGRKVKQLNTEFGIIEDDGLGRTKLFLTMKGPLSNPKISYDRKGSEEKIVNEIKKEKQQLKNILRDEFNWFKKDTAIIKDPPKKKKEELQIERDEDGN